MEKILLISPSTQDKKTWALTIVMGILPLAFFGWKMLHSSDAYIWAILFVAFLAISVIGFVATPYKYILTNTQLIVKRHWRDICIPMQEIKSIYLMPKSERKTLWKSFGFNGPFGHIGYFQTNKHKRLNVYARHWDNWMVVVTNQKKYAFAPDDLQLIDMVTQQIGQPIVEIPPVEASTFRWRIYVPVAVVLAVTVITYLGYKEPKVELDSNAFKLKGMFRVNIPFASMSMADTITWNEMPNISMRTGGISLFAVHRGRFRATDGANIRLNVHSGVNPVIKIVDSNGLAYYINRKDPTETRQIFTKIQENVK